LRDARRVIGGRSLGLVQHRDHRGVDDLMKYSAETNLVYRNRETGATLIADSLGFVQPAEGYELLSGEEAVAYLREVNVGLDAVYRQQREDAKEDLRLAREREVVKHGAYRKLLRLGLDPVEASA